MRVMQNERDDCTNTIIQVLGTLDSSDSSRRARAYSQLASFLFAGENSLVGVREVGAPSRLKSHIAPRSSNFAHGANWYPNELLRNNHQIACLQ